MSGSSVVQEMLGQLDSGLHFFKNTLSCFEEEDSGFAPQDELYTVAGHVAHTADTVDWFMEGAFGSGWAMDFDKHVAKAKAVISLAEAVEWLDRSYAAAKKILSEASEEELFGPIPDKAIMDGAPRKSVVTAITDHTAHHRGSLAVYARLIGKEPLMPYS